MASFNLGRIKGDTGERGPMGETGPKGERGDKGADGTNGSTPVFSIDKTETLSPSAEAYVELNSNNPQNPVLSFYIPRGRDGQDALGDMLSGIYDKDGIREDIFKYADRLFSGALKIGGGTLVGGLKACETDLSSGYVRNISVRSSLPGEGANGDICVILYENGAKTLGDCAEGSILLLDEAGKTTEYIICGKDSHRVGGVTVMRKDLAPYMQCFDRDAGGAYALSDLDLVLESTYKGIFSKEIRDILMAVHLEESACYRQCFALALTDFTKMSYFSDIANRIASENGGVTAKPYLTRSLADKRVYCVESSGGMTFVNQTEKHYYRPCIVLPAETVVVNTEHNSKAAVCLPVTKKGIYVCRDGIWKECF